MVEDDRLVLRHSIRVRRPVQAILSIGNQRACEQLTSSGCRILKMSSHQSVAGSLLSLLQPSNVMNVGATGDDRVGESRSTGWPLLSRPVGIITRMIYSWREEKTGWLISIQKAGFQFFFLYYHTGRGNREKSIGRRFPCVIVPPLLTTLPVRAVLTLAVVKRRKKNMQSGYNVPVWAAQTHQGP